MWMRREFGKLRFSEVSIMVFMRIRGSIGVLVPKKRKIYFVQFSLKDPWLLPKHEPHYKKDVYDWNMYGWLLFYFGTMPIGQKR